LLEAPAAGENRPASHAVQADTLLAPVSWLYLPAGHSWHSSCPKDGLKVPAVQASQAAAPADAACEPGLHSVQAEIELEPFAGFAVPAGHSSQRIWPVAA